MAVLFALAVAGVAFAAVFAVTGIPHISAMHPMYHLGIVFPTCGLTRGVVAVARGDLGGAWAYNPASFAVVLVWSALIVRAVIGRLRGVWFGLVVDPRIAIAVLALCVAVLWVNQQSHAALLING